MKSFYIKNLKIMISIILVLSLSFAIGFAILSNKGKVVNNGNIVSADDYTVSGGKLTYNFDTSTELQNFSLYGEFSTVPYWKDGKVYCRSLEEQKMILNNYTFSEVEITADVITLSNSGKFDGGFYIQASNAGNGMDKINAYSINIEHGVGASTYIVKLHQFNQAWSGIKVEKAGITLQGNVVKLKAVVKAGTLYVFADDMDNPLFSYAIGTTAGQIGFRSFYSPHAFDNLTIVSPSITLNKAELESLKTQASNMVASNKYTQNSVTALNSAISLANSANTSEAIENAILALNKALKKALEKKSFAELTTLINQANLITDSSKYTTDSYASFKAVLTYAKALTSSSAEHDIAHWYNELDLSIKGLAELLV